MFQGQATLMRANPLAMKVFKWGMVLMIPVFAALFLASYLPKAISGFVTTAVIGVYLAGYVAALSRGLKPLQETVDLCADARGLFTRDRFLVPRETIVEAYLRPAIAGQSVKGVVTPAWPLTVELLTTSGQLNVDAGSEASAGQILSALGFPITTVPATHIPRKVPKAKVR